MARPVLALAALCLATFATATCAHEPPVLRPEFRGAPVAVANSPSGLAQVEGAWELEATSPDFGGISAAALEDGRLWLLSDRSRLFEVAWSWPPSGQAFTAPILAEDLLLDRRGRDLDSEAFAQLPNGGHLVSDEAMDRLVPFARHGVRPNGASRAVGTKTGSEDNQGVEAMAFLPDGSLLGVNEAETGGAGLHDAVSLAGNDVTFRRYRSAPGFSPTDAAVAGAYLFLLERRLSLLGGWQARIVAVPVAGLPQAPGSTIEGRELVRLSGSALGENYEGLAAAADGAGYRLLVISDDNFNLLQRTMLVSLRWSGDEAPVAGLATSKP